MTVKELENARAFKAQAQKKGDEARAIVERAKAANRDLTESEARDVDNIVDEMKVLRAKADTNRLVAELAAVPNPGDGMATGTGSRWANAVAAKMHDAAGAMGVKALLTGEITTPPAVEVVDLPAEPSNLLELIPRALLAEQTFSYLRQTVRTNNAAVVADGGTKPTSVFTFEEVEDRARVVAHLSEPFPIRYLSDHASMIQVLDQQMRQGVYDALSDQVVNGDGTGENLTGILATTGVTAVPFATDVLTTIRKARTALEVKGERPTAWVFNPADVEALELIREDGATGGFLMDAGAYDAVFGPGVQRVSSLAVAQGTAVLGDWSKARLRVREDVSTLAATQSGDLFETNRTKLRTEGRYGFEVLRPQAFAVVDLTA